jgi:hypothetical protein
MTASAVFVKRDRTPVDGQHDPPLAPERGPCLLGGVSLGGIEPGEGTVSQSNARGLRMRGSPPVALRQINPPQRMPIDSE